jgi:hypothetical protein
VHYRCVYRGWAIDKGGGVDGIGAGRGGGYLAGVRAGGREFAPRANALLALLTCALLAALVTTLARLFLG